MIRMENACFGYGADMVLRGLNLHIAKGEFVAVIGENGAGKSTFSKLLNGLNKPSAGRVLIDGEDTRRVRTSALAKKVSFLFQNPDRQLCKNTIEEEIRFGLELVLQDKQEIQRRLEETIRDFGFDPAQNPFSGGRGLRQRIALADLLALKPQLLILDEPTTGLDYRECMHIMKRVQELNREMGATVVMVSHDMELVQEFARRVLVLKDGGLFLDGPVGEIMAREEELARASLLPPQIVSLCNRLGDEYRGISDYMQMADAIERRRAK
ncbi:MAG: ABC transporter ATP-binding protein [Eubacteriales bacterium]|nr:ABC transporter ATP-binding protein [Eubacteriales bacterium]